MSRKVPPRDTLSTRHWNAPFPRRRHARVRTYCRSDRAPFSTGVAGLFAQPLGRVPPSGLPMHCRGSCFLWPCIRHRRSGPAFLRAPRSRPAGDPYPAFPADDQGRLSCHRWRHRPSSCCVAARGRQRLSHVTAVRYVGPAGRRESRHLHRIRRCDNPFDPGADGVGADFRLERTLHNKPESRIRTKRAHSGCLLTGVNPRGRDQVCRSTRVR